MRTVAADHFVYTESGRAVFVYSSDRRRRDDGCGARGVVGATTMTGYDSVNAHKPETEPTRCSGTTVRRRDWFRTERISRLLIFILVRLLITNNRWLLCNTSTFSRRTTMHRNEKNNALLTDDNRLASNEPRFPSNSP